MDAFVRLPEKAELNAFTAAVAAAASFVLQRLNPLAGLLHFPFSRHFPRRISGRRQPCVLGSLICGS